MQTQYTATLRTTGGDVLATATGDSVREALSAAARKARLTYREPVVVNRFPGGCTYHVQFGKPVRTGGYTLGDLYVARVEEQRPQSTVFLLRHLVSGEVYAVETRGETITAAAGPLHYSEHPAALAGDFDDDPETREWIAANRGQFTSVEEVLP